MIVGGPLSFRSLRGAKRDLRSVECSFQLMVVLVIRNLDVIRHGRGSRSSMDSTTFGRNSAAAGYVPEERLVYASFPASLEWNFHYFGPSFADLRDSRTGNANVDLAGVQLKSPFERLYALDIGT